MTLTVFRYLRKDINANTYILIFSIIFDVIVLSAFLIVKRQTDMMVIYAALTGIALVFVGERYFLRANYKHQEK